MIILDVSLLLPEFTLRLDVRLEAQVTAIMGPSGAGKTTLLHIAGLLEKPDSGEILISGEACNGLNDDDRTRLRRHNVGFVYQYHHLLPDFSAIENIAIPPIIAGPGHRQARARAAELLACLGLTERAGHRPGRLSGGEQQRVAIGRALANAPKLLLADEPTGNLDPDTASGVFQVLLKLVRGAGLAAEREAATRLNGEADATDRRQAPFGEVECDLRVADAENLQQV